MRIGRVVAPATPAIRGEAKWRKVVDVDDRVTDIAYSSGWLYLRSAKDAPRFKVVRMLLLHDIVEIDAGDAFLHEAGALAAQAQKEEGAAQRIFGLLPADQRDEWLALWHEFEAAETPEAVLAHAFDRVQPALLHEATDGVIWQKYGTTHEQIQSKVRVVRAAAPALWERVQAIIARAKAAGRFG